MRILGVLGVAMAALATTANADLVLTLDDTSTAGIDVVVIDQGSALDLSDSSMSATHADGDGTDGVVFFTGAVGSFTVNVSTGLSGPVIGPARIDLNSVNVSGSAGELTIGLTDTDFYLDQAYPYRAIGEIGGTTDGTVSMIFGADDGNTEFGFPVDSWGTMGAFSGPFSDTASVGGIVGNPFSISQRVTVTHGSAADVTSFDSSITVVPAPAAALLGMMGFGAIGAVRRRLS